MPSIAKLFIILIALPLANSESHPKHISGFAATDWITPPTERPEVPCATDTALKKQEAQFRDPVTGVQRIIVILVDFTDIKHSESRSSIETRVFSRMDTYWREVSFNSIQILGSSVGWYGLGHSMTYYGADGKVKDDPNNDGKSESWWLIRDAVEKADPDVDFRQYGHVMVIHAGFGQESDKKRTDLIWSCRWSRDISTNDGATIKSATITPEYEVDGDTLGVDSHEFGHDLGLPDLYDVDGEEDFVGQWCLMGKGSWNGRPKGSSPAHPMARCKARLGWLSASRIRMVYSSETASLEPLDSSTTKFQMLKIPLTDERYYLVEVRLRRGFDSSLPSEGVIVSLVDERKRSGEGIVRVIDANPSTETLNDAAWTRGQTFRDTQNNISVTVESLIGPGYSLKVERSPVLFYFTIRIQHNVWVRIDNNNYSINANDPFRLQLPGREYVVEVQSSLRVGPGSRTFFRQWSDGDTSNPRTIGLFHDTTLVAVYVNQYYLEIRSRYGTTNGTGWYDAGALAHFSVSPVVISEGALQYQFERWEGDISASTPSSTILMDGPKAVTAVWRTAVPMAIILTLIAVVSSCVAIPIVIVKTRKKPARTTLRTQITSCPRCHHILRWVPERQRWYCATCAKYV